MGVNEFLLVISIFLDRVGLERRYSCDGIDKVWCSWKSAHWKL